MQSQIPVLANTFAKIFRNKYAINLIDDAEAVELYLNGDRLYSVSENALDWVYKNLADQDIIQKINIMKDKAELRRQISELYKDFFFKELTLKELYTFDIKMINLPIILKPSVGFFSLGVYTIFTKKDWNHALENINHEQQVWSKNFPDSVVGTSKFIIEQYITGVEYAIDAYFDDNGKPVILNIFTHKFASAGDVKDRIYYTSKEIIEKFKPPFEKFLIQINEKLCIKNFPMHVEVRVDKDNIVPIEFNPMRFAGLCCTDIAYYAYGINTVDYYINNKVPNFDEILKDKTGKIYSLIVLDKADKTISNNQFDYQKLINDFEHVLALRKVENDALNIFGFLFTETSETSEKNDKELDDILTSDLMEYVIK